MTTLAECGVCHEWSQIIVWHSCKVGKTNHVWAQCGQCELREMQTQDERASEAIEQAERAGA